MLKALYNLKKSYSTYKYGSIKRVNNMKIMYIAPRFHTNQVDTVKGLLNKGDEVKYICYYASQIEDYSLLKPVVLGFSFISQFISAFYTKVIKRNCIGALDIRINYGIPPVFKLKRLIRDFNPDILILRERSFYSIVANLVKPQNTVSLLYNQSPYYDDPPKKDLLHKVVYFLTPQYRYTPVLGKETDGHEPRKKDYFLPFVIEPHCEPENRLYFQDNKINIMCVGVFTPRKNHIMLLEAINKVREELKLDIRLTFVGEAVDNNQIAYLDSLKKRILQIKAEEWIIIYTNLSRQEVFNTYLKNDLFIIPSTQEPASVSQLEAMCFSLPAIVSDSNGTSCYTINGSNGYLFKDNDIDDLINKIKEAVSSRENLINLAHNAYESIIRNNSFEKYYDGINRIANDIRKNSK